MRNLITGLLLFIVGQSLIWFQTNGQFIWPWFKRNPLIVSLIAGTGISYMFILATRLVADYYDGALWPGRFIAQASGIVIFAGLTFVLLDEVDAALDEANSFKLGGILKELSSLFGLN